MVQVDWADFCFSHSAIDAQLASQDSPERLQSLDVLLRCADNGWFELTGTNALDSESLDELLRLGEVMWASEADLKFMD